MPEKLITKSFERLLDKGKHRGFITYEELGKSLGKRNSNVESLDTALVHIFDQAITLVKNYLAWKGLVYSVFISPFLILNRCTVLPLAAEI